MNTEHQNLTQAIRNNGRISAIKALRVLMSETGSHAGLVETKRIVDAIFDAVPASSADADCNPAPDDAHYIVSVDCGNEWCLTHYKGYGDNRQEAMQHARTSVDAERDVYVSRVVAQSTVKRWLEHIV